MAVGDLHGDLPQARKVLQLAGIIDAEGHWAAGDTTFVQTGDTTDRGPDSKAVMDLVRQLQEEAPAAGGQVLAVMGNHEVMNIQGDWRYVNPDDVAAFGGPAARKKAFGRTGVYGPWLESLGVVAQVDDTVFTHGGLTEQFAKLGLDAVNERARKSLFVPPRPDTDPVHADGGPTWYRGYVNDPETTACPRLKAALEALGAKRMVVGHTTRRDGKVLARCNGAFAVIDVGIATGYGGNLAAWELVDGDARALTPAGVVDLPDP